MSSATMNMEVADEAPWADGITEYDKAHLVMYLRLLDARADGASTEDMAHSVLGIDATRDPQRAERAVFSHLRRAQWITDKGYREFLGR